MKLETIYEGTTFLGCEIEMYENDGTVEIPIILTGADIKMSIRRKGDDIDEAEYSTTNGKLTIDNNKIIIPEHTPTLEYGKYEFDFNIILGEMKWTGVAQGEWEILNPITKR